MFKKSAIVISADPLEPHDSIYVFILPLRSENVFESYMNYFESKLKVSYFSLPCVRVFEGSVKNDFDAFLTTPVHFLSVVIVIFCVHVVLSVQFNIGGKQFQNILLYAV